MIVGIGCWRGCGATTLATLVATTWAARGQEPWLIEADPAGGVLTARLAWDDRTPAGLETIAFPEVRGGTATAEERFAAASAAFAGTRVVTAPGDPFRAWACHLPRLPWAPLLRDLDAPVVVDLGRIRGGMPNASLLAQLDILLLATAGDAVSLVATMEWAAARGRMSPGDAGLALDITRIAVIDPAASAARVSRTDAEDELGDRFAGWMPWAPAAVDLVERGALPGDRRFKRQSLIPATSALVDRLEWWAGREVAA